jgi:hypothetical protein
MGGTLAGDFTAKDAKGAKEEGEALMLFDFLPESVLQNYLRR